MQCNSACICSQKLSHGRWTLSLLNPRQVIVALAEIGPVIAVLPFLFIWGYRAWQAKHWLYTAVALSALLSLAIVFVSYTGSEGEANTTRLYVFLELAILFFVPLIWN
jgi:hypothetical protein